MGLATKINKSMNFTGAAAIGGMFGNVEDSITKIVETAIKQGFRGETQISDFSNFFRNKLH